MKLSIILSITFLLCSCSNTRSIEGNITAINGRNVTVQGQSFKVLTNDSLYIGKFVTFTPTVNRKIINSKRLK